MSRLHALAATPRRSLGALAAVLAAAGLTAGSGANFTAQSSNPANAFVTGTLTIGNNHASAVLSSDGMIPGSVARGTADIQNTGNVAAAFSLGMSHVADSTPSLLGEIDLKIDDCGRFHGDTAPSCDAPTHVYSGKLAAMGSRPLGTFGAHSRHRYKFTATLPASTNSTFQAKSASVQFDWHATTASTH